MLVVFLSYLLVAFIRFVNKLKKSGIIEYPNRYPIWGTLWVPAFSIGPIFNVHYCLDCTEVVYGQENLETHLCNEAIQENNLFEFNCTVPKTGLIHFKINAAKSFINLTESLLLKKYACILDLWMEMLQCTL